ncbi:hypothetical protein P9A51_gp05 [Xanthomonas phage Xp12]|uniref:Uncharacterized protein n=1 Tax=Xanthomonas phage Xp12 TaxID=2746072 RepID=A0A7G9UT05_9CAUD|nr:hypothetical protein P9A51_gp05 [Xanthomonas phage Xp12]QNN97160.1 hypothetical protein [Xanthomonas phage Xp12]
MKTFDPSAIVPYAIVPLSDQEAIELCDQRDAGRARHNMPPMTTTQALEFQKHVARERADEAWLLSNTPMGTVFDLLGVSHMVVSHPHRVDTPERPGPGPWKVQVFAPDGRGGIDRSLLTCRQLRAMLEPGFTAP